MRNEASGRRLFFALWPDAASRAALARLQTLVEGRLVPPPNLHLTLAFLGQQPDAALAPLSTLLDGLTLTPMDLELDRLGHFARQGAAWAGMSAPPPALLALQLELMTALERAGFTPASHGAFRPHVTLARHAPAPRGDGCGPVRWRAGTLALVASGADDGRYRVLRARGR